MVRRRSTARSHSGAPGRHDFSNNSDDRRGTSRKRRSSAPIAPIAPQGPGGSTEGNRRRSFRGGPDHRRASRESPRDEALRYPLDGVRGRLLPSCAALLNDRSIRECPAGRSPTDRAAGATRRLTLMPNSGRCSIPFPWSMAFLSRG